ncbi:hypothetical protein M406DRAFT_325071 [Cryphonectria parasitica EP155]|uniref:Uncharacterized protein n=1 Tax=Cryphonectria parasitica (strain ATCC 38755 / EP155) TaxID=660469 RepID=A0A9P4YAZ3_CRYP1|nr:uncharacterized protein M406DRAFT_325071 [Cryphonectria parasitica EP155]KAF3769572.1 hypothetical protein M406DRAFT_325071 [Cryphonectria parasitica EP155]
MEATKNLASRLRHRASLRRSIKKTARPTAADRTQPNNNTAPRDGINGQQRQQQQAMTREGQNARNGATASVVNASGIPADAATDDPPTPTLPSPTAAAAISTAASLATGPATPPVPSPGSDVSPLSQVPRALAVNGTSFEKSQIDTATTGGYFALAKEVDDVSGSNKITFAIPTKPEAGLTDGRAQEQESESPGLETAVSSATPSPGASLRDSTDDATTDAGQSSTGGRS